MSPAADSVIQRLDGARQKWWLVSLLCTAVLAVCASLGTLMTFMLADSWLKFSQLMLVGLFLAWLLCTLAILLGVGRRMLFGQRSLEAAARRVEAEFPELGSNLINVVQLAEDHKNVNRAFCEAAIRQAAAQLEHVAFDRAPNKQSRLRRFVRCMQTPRDLIESLILLAMLVTAAVVCERYIPNWASAASRLLKPWQFVPSVGSVEIVGVTPGNADVLVGESVEIAADIRNPEGKPHRGLLLAASDGEPESPMPMTADEKHEHYRLTVPSVLKPLKYRLEIGDSQTEVFRIAVREKPVVESVEVAFRYPAYLGRKSETIRQKGLDLEAPQYTVAELRLRLSAPVARGYLESAGERFPGRVEEEGRLLVANMPLLKDGSYSVRLSDNAGHGDANPRINRVVVLSDRPPTAELLKPARQSSAAPGTSVPVAIRAGDDHGIGRLRLEMKVSSPTESETVVKQWTDFAGDSVTTAVRQFTLELKPELVKPGQTVLIRAVANDKRVIGDWGLDLKPQEGASGWHTIKIVAEEAQASALLEQLENLRSAIWKILEKQIQARTIAATALKDILPSPNGRGAGGEGRERKNVETSASPQLTSPHPNPLPKGEGTIAAADLRTRQIEIQKLAADIVQSIGPNDRKERLSTKRILNALAFGDMLQAVTRCEELMKLKPPAELKKPAGELTAAQDRIIAALRKLLDATRHAQADALADMKKRPGGNLPDDVKQKFEAMRDKLAEFLKQQKKVIEATENLAKTPVEDFTKEEEEKLKGMAAAEDEWSKFMKDLHSDLSKLPEQDFANSSMAKELVEIQTELKMAEDALLKKSVDIAVPVEQLGYEMAEEIKTNFEKWLPDTPDREKWSQEESPTDKDKEAPMAQLPSELEDIVGDLMEKEEDLFDEMEDVSSSAAESADKGAGWDAMDGPISVMSAKGVTGNRLPNTSEIGGRSGEGRQGKSSGEFVGDEAVGKGGRKTPSRLTPDAFVKGQIKDHSKQSPGGATGGGKESGKGGEGLEGPQARAKGQRDAERLAGKQAALRNKAEAVDLKFQVSNFHRTDLKKMIEIMAQVERDLKAGRYQNALRQRPVLVQGLGNVKQYLDGEFEVRGDATVNLPADIQKEILGSMQDPSPAGWEEMNREYFERLSGGGDSGGDKTSVRRENGKGEKGE
jgi:hypothetical protein